MATEPVWRLVARVATLAAALQLLLVPSYTSTDYEVHRHWLAITASLPPRAWYPDLTSPWTLDYPPLFAGLEWALAPVARWADPAMVVLSNLEYDSARARLFLRGSTILTGNAALGAALASHLPTLAPARRLPVAAAVLLSPGLMMVDHIHFQYNGLLLGLLLLTASLLARHRPIAAAAAFTALLNLKHLYLIAAPVVGVHLLRAYCFESRTPSRTRAMTQSVMDSAAGPARRIAALAAVAVIPTALSVGPFLAWGQGPLLLRRLFPFGRGLLHAYWAPNAWALYATADKLLAAGVRIARGDATHTAGSARLTGGLVGATASEALPSVTPAAAAALVVIALVPCLVTLGARPRPQHAMRAVGYAGLCGFVFGWHVHEKAVLGAVMPLACVFLDSPQSASRFLVLSTIAHHSLGPLLYQPREWVLKHGLTALGFLAARAAATAAHPGTRLLSPSHRAYLWGLVPLELLCCFLPHALPAWPFAPLWLTSVYCAAGVVAVWAAEAVDWARLAVGREGD